MDEAGRHDEMVDELFVELIRRTRSELVRTSSEQSRGAATYLRWHLRDLREDQTTWSGARWPVSQVWLELAFRAQTRCTEADFVELDELSALNELLAQLFWKPSALAYGGHSARLCEWVNSWASEPSPSARPDIRRIPRLRPFEPSK